MSKKKNKTKDLRLAIAMDGFNEEDVDYADITLPDGSGLRVYAVDEGSVRLETHSPVRKLLVKMRTYQGISVTHKGAGVKS